MTFDPLTDSFECYHEALRALRHQSLMAGAIPLPHETVDIMLLNEMSSDTPGGAGSRSEPSVRAGLGVKPSRSLPR